MKKGYLVSLGFTAAFVATLAIATGTKTIEPLIAQAQTITPAQCTGETRFVAIGDTGHDNAQAAKTGKAIANVCSTRGCDLILHVGDIIYPNGAKSATDPAWKSKFEKWFGDVVKVRWYFVMGNHDYGAPKPENPKPSGAAPYIAYAANRAKVTFPAPSYAFQKGPVDFFAIDSTLLGNSSQRDTVIKTVKAQLEKSTAPWRIAFAHHPLISNGDHNVPDPDVVKGYNELVCNRKVHMLISGHDHNRQWFKDNPLCPKTNLVISGAGSSIAPLSHKNTPAIYQNDKENGFFYVRARCTTLYGAFYDADGKIDFEYTLSK